MRQKYSILYASDCETIKVPTNALHHNPLPGQDLTLKIAQIFFENSCEQNIAS